MLPLKDLERLLFIDIETAHGLADYNDLSEVMKKHWARRARRELRLDEPPTPEQAEAAYYDRAAIPAEFGRVVCVSIGYLVVQQQQPVEIRLKSYYGTDERTLLASLVQLLHEHVGPNQYTWQRLCGHNIKEFDVPFLARRCLVHGLLPLPYVFNLYGMKPWDVPHVDTMELWKFGDYKSFTALELLAELLGIPSPKGDIDGSQVSRVYWQEEDLARIAHYCEQDVATTVNIMLRLSGYEPIIEHIRYSH
ncbi:MAG: ribonuclease H-like domain-containing protein [Bacteroidetes bacterium]|jgi:predicted PolB exonuclease-like 3'-5' exonuclease|nr:ribonuclease H-like domain-containing protein [Bacteroidota bacterium]